MSAAIHEFVFSSNTDEPPTGAQVRFNATTYDTVSKLWIRNLTQDGRDVFYSLMTLAVGDELYVQDKNDHTRIVKFEATALPVDKSTYVEVAVLWQASGPDLLLNGQAILLVLPEAVTLPPIPPEPGDSLFIQAPWHSPQACYSVLVTPPALEPLTLEEGKLRAGLDWTSPDPRDDLMTGFIAAARNQVEQDTGLALLTQTRDVTLTPTLTGLIPLPPQSVPLQSITELTALTSSRQRLVLDPRTLITWTRGWGGTVRLMDWDAAWSAVTIRIIAGWPTLADLKMQAPLLVQAVGLLTAHYATLGRDLASTTPAQAVPMGYDAAIDPYRLVWVT